MPAILLTRPSDDAQRFGADLYARLGRDAAIVMAPVLDIRLQPPVKLPNDGHIPVFTSRHGVAAYGSGQGPCFTVGGATSLAARRAGFSPLSANGDAEALFQLICQHRPSQPLLHMRGTHSTGALAQRLQEAGFRAGECVVYSQERQPLSADALTLLSGVCPVIVPLFSPRSARALFDQVQPTAPLCIAAISGAVAQTGHLPSHHSLRVAKTPDVQAMLDAVCDLWQLALALEAGGQGR